MKSMSRSDSSFNQLLSYLEKDETLDRYTWNMYADWFNSRELEDEFINNTEYIKEARGKVYMYHEVLSLQDNNLTQPKQREILFDLANEYVKQRADNHLVYGAVHNDTDNLHMHLIISSNRVNANKRTRLSKQELAQIQFNVQEYKNTKYKELALTNYYTKTKDRSKSKQKEQEIKHSRGKQTIKEQVRENLKNMFENSFTKEQLRGAMKQKAYEFTRENKSVKVNGRSYRLKTLGLEKSYQNTLSKFDRTSSREQKRSESKKERTKKREPFTKQNSSQRSSSKDSSYSR